MHFPRFLHTLLLLLNTLSTIPLLPLLLATPAHSSPIFGSLSPSALATNSIQTNQAQSASVSKRLKKGSAGHIACCIFTIGLCPGGPLCQVDMKSPKRSVPISVETTAAVEESAMPTQPANVEKANNAESPENADQAAGIPKKATVAKILKKGSPKHIACCIFTFGICPIGPRCNVSPRIPKRTIELEGFIEKKGVIASEIEKGVTVALLEKRVPEAEEAAPELQLAKSMPAPALTKRLEKGSPGHIACCFFTLGLCPGGPNCRFPKAPTGIRPNAADEEKETTKKA